MAAVKLIYFAWVREKIGQNAETVEIPESITTIGELLAWLKTRGPEYAAAFENDTAIRASINQAHVAHTAKLSGAREIAFFPPVTGG